MLEAVKKFGWSIKGFLPRPVFVLLKSVLNQTLSRRRARLLDAMPVIDESKMVAALREAGIVEGDVLFVHSSLSKIGKVLGGAETVILALMRAVGETGTVVMPAFLSAEDYVAMLKAGEVLDLRLAPSVTGKVTETFRQMPGTLRSSHPFASCCARGKMAEFIVRDHASDPRIAHGRSPLGRVLELGGKIVGLGTDVGTISIYHCVEDVWNDFPFATYGPSFPAEYIDGHGERVTRPLVRFDPAVSKNRIDQPFGGWIRGEFARRFERTRILRKFTFGCAPSWIMSAQQLCNDVRTLSQRGVTIYSRPSEESKRILENVVT